MKLTALLLLAIAYSALADKCDQVIAEWIKLIGPFEKQCIEETNVTKEYAEDFLVKLQYLDDPDLQCYVTCLHRRLGIMLSDNSIDVDTLTKIAEGVDKSIAEDCNEKVKLLDNPCHKSMEISKCIFDLLQNVNNCKFKKM